MSITFDQMRRLAFIRYLHSVGIDQAKLPDPLAAVSVLSLHDAVESFLLLVAEKFGVESREFEKYWKEIGPHLPGGGLPGKTGMVRLNKARVALKHYGSQPNKHSIDQAVSDVATFFSASTQLVFGIEYETVSMVSLIGQPEIKSMCEDAEQLAAGGDIVSAMIRLREAFDRLFGAHRPFSKGSRSPFSFGPSLHLLEVKASKAGQSLLVDPSESEVNRDLRAVLGEIERLPHAISPLRVGIRLAALSIDYAEYSRFLGLVPTYDLLGDGSRQWQARTGYAPDRADFDFCLQFIVMASLRMAAADAQVAPRDWALPDENGGREYRALRVDPPPWDKGVAGI